MQWVLPVGKLPFFNLNTSPICVRFCRDIFWGLMLRFSPYDFITELLESRKRQDIAYCSWSHSHLMWENDTCDWMIRPEEIAFDVAKEQKPSLYLVYSTHDLSFRPFSFIILVLHSWGPAWTQKIQWILWVMTPMPRWWITREGYIL